MSEAGSGIKITMSTSLWIHWAQIAIRRADGAQVARTSVDDDRLGLETQEAISAICAVAFSMEALQRVIAAELKPAAPRAKKPKAIDFLEASLAAAIDLPEETVALLTEPLDGIYRLRNAAVHFDEVMDDAVPHPSGVFSSADAARYNLDTAAGAIAAMRRVYLALLEHPSEAFKAWVNGRRHALEPLL